MKDLPFSLDSLSEDNLKNLRLKIDQQLKNINKNKFNFVDIFCGAGGLSCGLEQAGFHCLLGVELDESFIKTFKKNHPDAKTFLGPISKLRKTDLLSLIGNKKIHLLAGGPPCQGFSTVGRGNPKDERNSLFLQYSRILKILMPDYILFENVTGILSTKNEDILKTIFSKFRSLGYEIDIRVLDAGQYGVPQRRRRAFILGARQGITVNFPKPYFDTDISGVYVKPKTVGDALSNLKAKDGKIYNHNLEFTKVASSINYKRLERIPEGKGIRYKEDEDKYLTPSLKLGITWEKRPENRLRERKFHRLDRKLPAPTIMTRVNNYYHPTEVRRYSIRELASFQSFPNEFEFIGSIASKQKQIGNAVPPLLAKALGKEIAKSIEKHKTEQNQVNKTKRKRSSKIIANIRKDAFIYKEKT